MNTFRKTTFRATLIAATLAALPLGANAAGLGRISVLSALGQPLRAEIELTATADELATMTAGIAPASAFKEASIAFSPVLGSVNMTVERRGKRSIVRLISVQPVNDPFLDVLVELSWASGRLLREYTFLLDPPGMPAPAASAGVTTAPVSEPPRAAAPRPIGGQARAQAASQPPAQSTGSTTYRVRRGDTLNKIAAQHKPAGVSIDQMLISLYRENREAFIDDNINRLKAGVILNVPDAQQAGDVPNTEAREQVVAHAADFAAYRRRVATRVAQTAPAKEADTDQRSGGRITPLIEEAAKPEEASKDQVKISRTESSATASATDDAAATRDTSSSRLQALEEDLVARDKALQEANERLAMLEKNISELQQLVEMKNANLAVLQQQAAPATPAAPDAPAPVTEAPVDQAPAAETPAAEEKPAEMAAPAPETAEPAEPATSAAEQDALDKELKDLIGAAESDTPESAETSEATEPPAAAEAPPAAATTPEPEAKPAWAEPTPAPVATPSFLDELVNNPNALYGGGAALALLLGYGLYRSRKSRAGAPEASVMASDMPSEQNSVFGVTGGQSVDTGSSSLIQTDFSQSGLSAIDADEGVDPVAEADVYMAYGRDAQAEEILLDATKADPTRTAIHLKLLEVYAQRKNLQQFETTATELYSVSGGKGDDWEKAVEMGRKLDPDNPLFLKKPVAVDAPPKTDAATPATSEAKPAPAAKDGFTAPDSAGGAVAAAGALAGGAAAVAASDAADKAGKTATGDAAKPAGDAAKADKPATSTEDQNDGAFDEPLDFAGAVPSADAPSPSQLKDTWAIPGELKEFTDSDHDDPAVAPEVPKKSADAAKPDIDAADLDFDLDESGEAKTDRAGEAAKTAAAQVDAEGFDATDSALEFDLDLSDASDKSLAETRVNSASEDSLAETQVEGIDDINLSSTEAGDSSGIDFQSVLNDAEATDAKSADEKKGADDVAMVDLEKTNLDSSLLDFDLELDDAEGGDGAGGMLETSLDLSDISLDLDDGDADDTEVSKPDIADVPDLPSFKEPVVSAEDKKAAAAKDSDDDMMDSLSKSVVTSLTDSRSVPDAIGDSAPDEEVDTKLELARAYEEMGDGEGARELLDEVVRDGNDAQKAQAKSILERLG